MVEQNWYAVLGITSSATAAEIKRAFRKLAHIYHPDKNSTPVYFEQFNQIKKAYEILGNTTSKQLYDQSLQLEGRSTKSQPSIQSIQDCIELFSFARKRNATN
jgi:DnaJ-class molecular chaperone